MDSNRRIVSVFLKLSLLAIISHGLMGCTLDMSITDLASTQDQPSTLPSNPTGFSISETQKASFEFYMKSADSGFNSTSFSISPSGSYVAAGGAGAPLTLPVDLSGSAYYGVTYIFQKDAQGKFNIAQTLRHPSLQMYGSFGISVSIDDDWLFVGSNGDSTEVNNSTAEASSTGAAFVFRKNSSNGQFEFHSKLKAPVGARASWMGFGVNLRHSGNHLVVASEGTTSGSGQGALYFYEFNGTNWIHNTTITSPDSNDYSLFGGRIQFDQGLLYASAKSNNGIPGKIFSYQYNGTTWVQAHAPIATTQVGGSCGNDFSVSGTFLAVGCNDYFGSNWGEGSVETFKYNGSAWNSAGIYFEGTNAASNSQFGTSLAIIGQQLFIGSQQNVSGGSGKISVYAIQNDGTIALTRTLSPSNPKLVQYFGQRLHTLNNELLIYQYQSDLFDKNPGSIARYSISASTESFLQTIASAGLERRSVSTNYLFGSGISIDESSNFIYVSSPGNEYGVFPSNSPPQNRTGAGTIQIYKKNSSQNLEALGAMAYHDGNYRRAGLGFGTAMASQSGVLAVGSPGMLQWFNSPYNSNQEMGNVSIQMLPYPFAIQPVDDMDSIESRFGSTLAFPSLDNLFIGATAHKLGSANKYGKVYSASIDLINSNYNQEFSIDAGTLKTIDMEFGSALSAANGVLAVGARKATDNVQSVLNAGGVWVYNYTKTTATLQNVLFGDRILKFDGSVASAGTAGNWPANGFFGSSVLVKDAFIFVGSPGFQNAQGRVFVYKYNSVTAQYEHAQTLAMDNFNNEPLQNAAEFGFSIAANGASLFIGAPGVSTDKNGSNSITGAGAVYVYRLNSGVYEAKLKLTPSISSARTANSGFGSSLASTSNTLIVGSPRHDLDSSGNNSVSNSGSISVFEISGN